MAKAKKGAVTKSSKASASKGVASAARATSAAAATPASVRAELAKLGKTALQKKFKEVFGRAPKSDNVHHLREALAKKLVPEQPAEATKSGTAETKAARPPRERDSRLPAAGTVIKRPYKGVTHEVKVLEDTFEYGDERHRSLSAIAKSITGQQTNGFLWFGLIAREDKTTAATNGVAAQPAEKRAAKRPAKKQARG
jgi:hypothetical protein